MRTLTVALVLLMLAPVAAAAGPDEHADDAADPRGPHEKAAPPAQGHAAGGEGEKATTSDVWFAPPPCKPNC